MTAVIPQWFYWPGKAEGLGGQGQDAHGEEMKKS